MRNASLLDINKFTPYAVGFDRLFDQMNKYLDNQAQSTGYPPYNITNINNQSCSEIAEKKAESESLQLTNFADGGYLILTPADKSYQTILTSSGETNCTMTESRMLWPGK